MKNTPTTLLGIVCLSLAGAACVHTPPGTSVEVALAKRAEPVATSKPPAAKSKAGTTAAGVAGGVVEPDLPSLDKRELVADAYSRGQFCMQAGKDLEAITAFRECVKIDPTFMDAWTHLAFLYEKTGEPDKALDAFKKAKTLAQH